MLHSDAIFMFLFRELKFVVKAANNQTIATMTSTLTARAWPLDTTRLSLVGWRIAVGFVKVLDLDDWVVGLRHGLE